MAKQDLLTNPDFEQYQKDLHIRLRNYILKLHDLIIQASDNPTALQNNMFKIYALKSVIAEIEIILELPSFYVTKEKRRTIGERIKKKIVDIWERIILGEEDTTIPSSFRSATDPKRETTKEVM